jgi:hypothetical protein
VIAPLVCIHPQATKAVAEMTSHGKQASLVWNARKYDGKGGRGWTIFEQGASQTVAAHLANAKRRGLLPKRVSRSTRHKLIDISGGRDRVWETSNDPQAVLEQTMRSIQHAQFSGDGDEIVVNELLARFDRVMTKGLTAWAASAQGAATKSDYGGVVLEMAGACW